MIWGAARLIVLVVLIAWYIQSVALPAIASVSDDELDALAIQEHTFCLKHGVPSEEAAAHGLTCEMLRLEVERITGAEGSSR